MKNKIKFLGIIALVAIVGGMTACKEEKKDPRKFWAEEFKISGEQVYYVEKTLTTIYSEWVASGASGNLTYPQYEKLPKGAELTHDNNIIGSGQINSSGKLSYNATTPPPTNLSASTIITSNLTYWDDVELSNNAVKVFAFSSFKVKAPNSGTVSKSADKVTIKKDLSYSSKAESVQYVYVNDDVTVTGKGKETPSGNNTYTTKNLKLDLKEGWNAIYQKTDSKGTYLGEITHAISISRSNPNLKWTLSGVSNLDTLQLEAFQFPALGE